MRCEDQGDHLKHNSNCKVRGGKGTPLGPPAVAERLNNMEALNLENLFVVQKKMSDLEN